jgi:putative sigma-54 modulation protein
MNIQVRGDQLTVTEALREYTEKKISKLQRYFETPLHHEVNVTLSVNRGLHTVEVTIPLQGVLLRAEETSNDMYASIDMVVDKLERQIRKHKTKVNRRWRREGVRTLFKEGADAVDVAVQTEEPEEDLQIVRTKRFTLKPMDVEEAILQMNLLGHNFFVFENSDTNEVNVVYVRKDGKYGLIEPVV